MNQNDSLLNLNFNSMLKDADSHEKKLGKAEETENLQKIAGIDDRSKNAELNWATERADEFSPIPGAAQKLIGGKFRQDITDKNAAVENLEIKDTEK
jgi:hypothetical protein